MSATPSADIPQFEINSGPGPEDAYVVGRSRRERGRQCLRGSQTRELAIAASSEQILRILSVMGIDRVIPIRPTVEEAASAVTG